MALLTVQEITIDGLEAAAGVAAGATGDTFANNGKCFIEVEDTGTTAPTVTIASQVACNQGETHDVTVDVQSGEIRHIGPFPTSRFNDADGLVTVTYSSETDVTIRVFQL
jgi:hypothetical protein